MGFALPRGVSARPKNVTHLIRAAVAILTGAALALVATPRADAITLYSARLGTYDGHLLADINHARAVAHRPPLTAVAGTTDVAHGWACWMAQHGVLAHRPGLSIELARHGSPSWRVIGENVGVVSSSDPTAMFNAYMGSPMHRANILSGSYRYVGVHTTRIGTRYWNTLDFVDSYNNAYGPTRSYC